MLGAVEPASVSIATNVDGYTAPIFLLSDGDADGLVANFYNYLVEIAQRSSSIMMARYEEEINFIEASIQMFQAECDSLKREYPSLASKNIWARVPEPFYRNYREICNRLNHFKMMRAKLDKFANIIPVLTFNGGRFDIPLIKSQLFPLIVSNGKKPLIIKKGGSYMAIQTDQLCFMDITFYMAPGMIVL